MWPLMILASISLFVSTSRASVITVWTESSLNANLGSDVTLLLGCDIKLSKNIKIIDIVNLKIIGGNFALDGQNKCSIFVFSKSTVILENITITSGSTDPFKSPYKSNGAGIYAESSELIIRNCNVTSNSALESGGGIFVSSSKVTLFQVQLLHNVVITGLDGGGVMFDEGSTAAMISCVVKGNRVISDGSKGGGLFLSGSTVSMRNCIVDANHASIAGGIYVANSKLQLDESEVTSNMVDDSSSKDRCGGLYITDPSSVVGVVGCLFSGNGIDVSVTQGSFSLFSACFQGQYNPGGSRMLSCDGCTGEYPADLMSSPCIECEPDTFSCCGSTSCDPAIPSCLEPPFDECPSNICYPACTAGKYCSDQRCVDCGPGLVSETGDSCNSCSAGYYAAASSSVNDGGQSEQVVSGATLCLPCPDGMYSFLDSSIVCLKCALGRYSRDASPLCNLAAVNYFISSSSNAESEVGILPCPTNAGCLGFEYAPLVLQGYWAMYDPPGVSRNIYPCQRATCSGAPLNLSTAFGDVTSSCWNALLLEQSNCDFDKLLCAYGSTGALCGSCLRGFSFSTTSNRCESCSRIQWQRLFTGGLVLLGSCVSFLLATRDQPLKMPLWVKGTILNMLKADILKIACSTYQTGLYTVIHSIPSNVQANYPPLFISLVSMMSFLSVDFLEIDCIDMDFSTDFITSVLVWSLSLFFLLSANVFVFIIRRLSSTHPHLFDQHLYFALITSYVLLPPVSLKQFQLFDCVQIDEKYYLKLDTSVDCSSSSYKLRNSANVAFICVYMSLPLLWFITLLSNRRHLYPDASDANLIYFMQSREASLLPFRFLFASYKPSCYYFEAVEMYRRIILVGILPLMSASASTRACYGVIITLLTCFAYRELRPYRLEAANVVSYVAQIVTLITYGFAYAERATGVGGIDSGIFLLLINLGIIFVSAACAMRQHRLEGTSHMIERTLVFEPWSSYSQTIHSCMPEDMPGCCLAYWYASLSDANTALHCGIPSLRRFHGIPLTLHGPMELDEVDKEEFPIREAVLVVIVQRRFLKLSPDRGFVRTIESSVVSSFMSLPDNGYSNCPQFLKLRLLVPRALLLDNPFETRSPGYKEIDSEPDIDKQVCVTETQAVQNSASIENFTDALKVARQAFAASNLVTVFLYTTEGAASTFLKTGLWISVESKGLYFSIRSPIGHSLNSLNIEASIRFDVCNGYDAGKELVVLAYGVEQSIISRLSMGNDRLICLEDSCLRSFSATETEGGYILRRDRICAAMRLDFSALSIIDDIAAMSETVEDDIKYEAFLRELLLHEHHDMVTTETQVRSLQRKTCLSSSMDMSVGHQSISSDGPYIALLGAEGNGHDHLQNRPYRV